MVKSKQIPLAKVLFTGSGKSFTLARATLLVHQEFISDGLGGHLEGLSSWELVTDAHVPLEVSLGSDPLTFEGGKYAGSCFLRQTVSGSHSGFQGTGPLKGA
jgi:hypothetical protein